MTPVTTQHGGGLAGWPSWTCPCLRTVAGLRPLSQTWPKRGRAGVAARVERHIGFARHVAQRARQHPRLELLVEPELSIVCFRYAASDAVNSEILLRLRRTTRSIPSSTAVGGHLAIRPCFINPHTRLADVDALVDHVITIGDELTGMQSR
jgi:aromatic-L-amino-acid/L-tryptophan decarboxylase